MNAYNEKTLTDYIGVIKRRKWQMILSGTLVFSIALIIALSLPAIYRSQATILIERQDIPTDLVRTTITGYADEQVQLLSQQVMRTTNMLKIIKKYDLYHKERETKTTEEILDTLREATTLEMISADVVDPRSGRPGLATIAFMLFYESKSPALAQKVANEFVTLYLNENLKSRSEKTANVSQFLAKEASRLRDKLLLSESKLASFKEKNLNQLPELTSLNLQLLQRTEQEVAEIKREISLRRERKIYLESELVQIDRNKIIVMASGERVLASEDRRKLLEVEYLRASAAYNKNHPDVIKLRREIKLLKAEIDGGITRKDFEKQIKVNQLILVELKQKYKNRHPQVQKQERVLNELKVEYDRAVDGLSMYSSIKPDNPAYIQLKAQLNAAESEIGSLESRLKEKSNDLKKYENRLTQTPQVEREYRKLTRDYESIALKYREISGKKIEAALAEQLEKESRGDRFSLIEPPMLSEKPIKPNRIAIIFLGFVFAIGGAIGLIAILESMDRKIRGGRSVAAILGVEPLVIVPYISVATEQKNLSLMKFVFLFGGVVVVLTGLGAIHFLYKPLDVIWFVILNKFGVAS